tara:strand:- start:36 stop:446 length:411 start_codon:yes stop_codon:yes gene_type:complete
MAKKKHAATFLGGSKSLVAIGDNHVYAVSGRVNVPNAFTTLLEYTTANIPYKVSLEVSIVSDSGTSTTDDYLFQLTLNDVTAASWVTDKSATLNLLMVPVSFIIPPLTKVKIRAYNNTDSTANQVYAWMYGKRLDA